MPRDLLGVRTTHSVFLWPGVKPGWVAIRETRGGSPEPGEREGPQAIGALSSSGCQAVDRGAIARTGDWHAGGLGGFEPGGPDSLHLVLIRPAAGPIRARRLPQEETCERLSRLSRGSLRVHVLSAETYAALSPVGSVVGRSSLPRPREKADGAARSAPGGSPPAHGPARWSGNAPAVAVPTRKRGAEAQHAGEPHAGAGGRRRIACHSDFHRAARPSPPTQEAVPANTLRQGGYPHPRPGRRASAAPRGPLDGGRSGRMGWIAERVWTAHRSGAGNVSLPAADTINDRTPEWRGHADDRAAVSQMSVRP